MRLIPSIVLWVLVFGRVATLKQGRTQRALWLTITACAIASTIDLPGIAKQLEGNSAMNLPSLAKHCSGLIAAAGAREVVRGLALESNEARHGSLRRWGLLGGVLAALAVLFILAPVHSAQMESLTGVARGNTELTIYWLIFVAFLSSALVSIVHLAWGFIQRPAPTSIRIGMSWVGLGAGMGLVYCVNKVGYLAGIGSAEAADKAQTVLFGLSIVFLVVGITWPSIGVLPIIRHIRAYRTYRTLWPLWRNCVEAVPNVVLSPPASFDRDALPWPQQIEMSVYRRAIEIRDGLLVIDAYVSPALPVTVRDVVGRACSRSDELLIAAIALELGRRAMLRGEPPNVSPEHACTTTLVPAADGPDLAAELQVLTVLARYQRTAAASADKVERDLGVIGV